MKKQLIDIERAANLEEISLVRHLLARVLATLAISSANQNNILLCFAELTSNIILHANPSAKVIRSQLTCDSDTLQLSLLHDGQAWQPERPQSLKLDNSISQQTHGRGLGLLQALCPDWQFQLTPMAGIVMRWPNPPVPQADKLLLVEDDNTMRTLLSAYLSTDYEIDCANNGQQAWQMLQQNNYLLVLSDIHMPTMDGLALREKTLSLQNTSLTPFIFISADSADTIKSRANLLAIDDYLVKPIDKQALLQTIDRVLMRYHQLSHDFSAIINQRISNSLPCLTPRDTHDWRFALIARNTGQGGGDLLRTYPQGDNIRLMLCDVEGHDIDAKFFAHAWAGYLHGLCKTQAANPLSLLLQQISQAAFADQLLQQKLLTLLALDLAPKGHFSYACAGHPAPLLICQQEVKQLSGSGMLAGLVADTQYQTMHGQLEPGQRLLLFTDGLFESAKTTSQRQQLEHTLLEQLPLTLTLPIKQAARHLMSVFEQYATLDSDDTLLLLIELNDN
ncbi:SpoIIE family protein phosphatase [Motilimonas eburnea]|uniref:SpoIIE family protein phosphatase n=1 Tax=Motilimonas eburnea TaxID=1737488 RepID=UPI001E52F2A9|nr:SpoIIE family protein phosphatase [Motilimonas eburnea]MCE2570761.1 SpoIIE family protein phosphatase [Motilimonas eburnea]